MIKEKYEINTQTCALIQDTDLSTVVVEKENTIKVNMKLKELLNYSCSYYGSSLEGRINGSKKSLGSKYKLPIIVEETKELLFFPTQSIENEECVWISLNNIVSYKKSGNKVCVVFENNQLLELNTSYESFENQVLRATKLLFILKRRKNAQK